MGQPVRLKKQHHNQTFAMALGSCTTRQSPCVNLPADILKEQDKLTGTTSDTSSNEAPTPLEAPTSPLIPPSFEDLSSKFIKAFIKTT